MLSNLFSINRHRRFNMHHKTQCLIKISRNLSSPYYKLNWNATAWTKTYMIYIEPNTLNLEIDKLGHTGLNTFNNFFPQWQSSISANTRHCVTICWRDPNNFHNASRVMHLKRKQMRNLEKKIKKLALKWNRKVKRGRNELGTLDFEVQEKEEEDGSRESKMVRVPWSEPVANLWPE